LRQIDAVFPKIYGDILPKVCKLKTRANVIGELGKLSAPFSVDKEDESSDRVGTTAAVVEDGGKVFVAALDNVLFKGAEQVEEKGVGKVQFGLGFLERLEYPRIGSVILLAIDGTLPGVAVVTENGKAFGFRRGFLF
jgi:hypothetical protein